MKTQKEQLEFATKLQDLIKEFGNLTDRIDTATDDEKLEIIQKLKENIQQQNNLRNEFMKVL